MKIALVHDYLKEWGGAERVLKVLSEMYPEAPIYTAFAVRSSRAVRMLSERRIIESGWGWFLKIPRFHSYFRFLLPVVWRSIDLSEYDVVITSCSGYIARGFRVREGAKIIAYCHTPPKWLYGYETPTGAKNKWWGKAYLALCGPFVRYFDYSSAHRVNVFIANSMEVARRIGKFYQKEARVVYPPAYVRTEAGKEERGDYYLVVARLVGAKGVELAVEVAEKLKRKLIIVGEGKRYLAHTSSNVRYTGFVRDEELMELYRRARGYLALAKDEDFGMTVVEAMSVGTPVIAYDCGGYRETVRKERGILVKKLTERGVREAVKELERKKWDSKKIMAAAKKFSRAEFERGVREAVGE